MDANVIIFILELLFSFIFVILTYKYYAKTNINCLISFIAIYTFLSMFLFIIFVPYDIEISYYNSDAEIRAKNLQFIKNIITIFFGLIYFISLIYGWFFSDFIMYYENSPNFNMCSRACGAIIDMVIKVIKKGIFIILGIIIFLFLIPILLFIFLYAGNEVISFTQKILILTSFPGILFFIILIGMSLLRLPKDIYYRFDFKSRINYLYKRIGEIDIKLNEDQNIIFDYFIELDKTIKNYDKKKGDDTVSKTLTNISQNLAFGIEGKSRNLYNILLKNISNYEIDISEEKINERIKEKENEKKEEDYIIKSTKHLGEINQKQRELGSEIERLIGLRNECYEEWLDKKSFLTKNQNNALLIEDKELIIKELSFFKELIYNYSKLISIILIILILTLNIGIIVLEFLYCFSKNTTTKSKSDDDLFFYKKPITKIFLIIPFFYFIFLSLYTVFSFGIENDFYYFKKGKTDGASIMYITKILMRISAVACVHIINMLSLSINLKQTNIEKFMGFKKNNNEKEKIYQYILIFSFILLVVIAILNLFDIPKIVMDKCYYKKEAIDESELIERGKKIMHSLNMKENITLDF